MLRELIYEVLRFCTRDVLERIHPDSRVLCDMITDGSNSLPLRILAEVHMSYLEDDKLQVYLTGHEDDDEAYEASLRFGGDFEGMFRRLQHSFIKRLYFDISENPFMEYWRAQDRDFSVKVINFGHILVRENADYGILDSVVSFLRPMVCEVFVQDPALSGDYNQDYLNRLAREPFLEYITTCSLSVNAYSGFPPMSFVLSEVGYPHYEIVFLHGNAANWADRLIEAVIRGECGNENLETVCVQWDVPQANVQSAHVLKRLTQPTTTNVPIPRADFVTCRVSGNYKVSHCDLYSFPIAKQRKRMDIFKWTTDYEHHTGRLTTKHAFVCELKNAN
ncbi:hypothetical protein AAVH_24952 [Aphelenchoides avenae]|nr:hypothetical protein AAVH_24952 [Aphelenchus avenae]